MNQAAFANMGGPRSSQQINHQAGGMQRNGGTSTEIQSQILNILRSQPIPQGWQQMISQKQRANIIHQMVTGLQMVKPDMTLSYAINVAAGFEMQQFTSAPDQEFYNNSHRGKLQEIKATRQNQANVQQQQFQNQQAAQMGITPQQMQARNMMNTQNHFQQGYGIPQPQQPGGPLAVPMQQQLSQNQRLIQTGNPAEMHQHSQNGQQIPNASRPGLTSRPQPQFNPEESQQINNIFRQMLTRLTDVDRANIARQVANTVPQQQHQLMQAQGIDPINAFIKSQATHTFMKEKQRRLQMAGQGLVPPTNTGLLPQARPTTQNAARQQQPHLSQTPQHPESSFGVGNLDQFVGQQQEGLRHQAAGQDVVPASNGQAAPAQMRGTPHQQPQGQFPPNGRQQPPNSFQPPTQPQASWNGSQNLQQNNPHTPQMPLQPPTPVVVDPQGQTPHQQALQGQLGGLSNTRNQRTPQQKPSMPTLNQPMDPPNQTKNDASQRPPQSTLPAGQQNRMNGQTAAVSNPQLNSGQQGQALPGLKGNWVDKLPPLLQEHLKSMPEAARKPYVLDMHRKQQLRMKQAAEAQVSGNPQSTSQPGTQAVAAGAKVAQTSVPQVASGPNPSGQPQTGNSFGRTNMQPQGSQQGTGQHDPNRLAPQRPSPAPLNEAQVNYMDTQNFPPAILNKNSSLGQLPDSVKTWRQLKDYINRSAQNLPPGSMQNVLGLQSYHMHQMIAATKRMQLQQAQANSLNKPPQGQSGPAPQAPPMVPPPINQTPVQGGPPSGFSMPVFPQPTPQDLHAARTMLPAQMKGLPDASIRQMIVARRQQDFLKANQQRLNPHQQSMLQRNNLLQTQFMNAQQNQGQHGQNPPGQLQQPLRNQGQLQQPQAVQPQMHPQQTPKQSAVPQPKQSQPNRQNHAPQAGQKGAKRSSNDDVIEVPDPKTQQPPRVPNPRPAQHAMTGMHQMTQEAFARLSTEQKAQVQARMQIQEAQAAQRAKMGVAGQAMPMQPSAASANQVAGRNAPNSAVEYEALKREVEQETPVRPVVPMSPRTRNEMVEKLKDETALMIQRIDQSLPIFLRLSKDKRPAKELLRMRLILLRQVRDPGFTAPVDNFTMTVQELQDYKNKLHMYFTHMMKNFQPPPGPSAAQAPAPTQANQPQQLNAANLQQQQADINAARVASAQKNQANNNNRPPAAPTTTHAPFGFGAQSPQGVSQMYSGKLELTQEHLKLPISKKRKPNQGASATPTPAQTMHTPVATSSPVANEAERSTVVSSLIKCPLPDCEMTKAGFATQEALQKHHADVHEPKEPAIKDPLDAAAYAIDSLRIALNLDENGKLRTTTQPKEDQTVLQPPAMKTTASSQGKIIKQEVSAPMSRNPTQTGPSPSSNLLRTPQNTAAVRTPLPDSKSGVKDTAPKASTAKSAAVTTVDPWANSNVKPEWFQEVFSEVANLNRSVSNDFVTDWLERNPFTPPTSPSSGEADRDSPQKSDISANDNLNINVFASGDDWLQSEWFDDALPGDMEALDMGDLMDMDWETALGKSAEEDEVLGKGKRRRDPMDPSDEWMKAWAPEKYEEKKEKESQRKR